MRFYWILAVLFTLPLFLPHTLHAAVEDMPFIGNIVVADANGDGSYESIVSTNSLHVWWRNVNYLNQRWARRSIIEVDISSIPVGVVINSAMLTINLTQSGTSASGPKFEFYGYVGDGVLELADTSAGDTLLNTIDLSGLGAFSIDITSYVQTLRDAGNTVLGINIRALDEGKTFNTFDEEFNSFGFQSTNTLFPGPVVQVDYATVSADGDISGDGSVNVADVLLAIRHVMGRIVLNSEQIARGDVYPATGGDGAIDVSDLLLIEKVVLFY